MQYWGLNFGSAWGSTAFDGLIDDVTVTNTANPPAPPPPPPSTPMTEVFLDFSNGVPSGLTLFGDAFVSPGETLDLDGAGDYGLLAGIPEWTNATHVTASVDFRFDDPGDLDYARPIYNDGAFGFDIKGNALNAMVMTDSGVQRIYVGNQQFSDLQWHTVTMDLDTETDQLTITVDGQTVVDRSDLDVIFPQPSARRRSAASAGAAGCRARSTMSPSPSAPRPRWRTLPATPTLRSASTRAATPNGTSTPLPPSSTG
jgi:hypothetical protein